MHLEKKLIIKFSSSPEREVGSATQTDKGTLEHLILCQLIAIADEINSCNESVIIEMGPIPNHFQVRITMDVNGDVGMNKVDEMVVAAVTSGTDTYPNITTQDIWEIYADH